jgi:redox-sensitive bicupin YhaK (pirin superfamily)
MAIMANDGASSICVEAVENARLIIVAGKPLNEPIAQYGPFVMNTADEIQQTLRDYRAGVFERSTVKSV